MSAVETSPVAEAAIIPFIPWANLAYSHYFQPFSVGVLLAGCKQQLFQQGFGPKRLFSQILGGKITPFLGGTAAVRNAEVCSIFIRDRSVTTLESSFFSPLSFLSLSDGNNQAK